VFRIEVNATAVDTYKVRIAVAGVALPEASVRAVNVFPQHFDAGLYFLGTPCQPDDGTPPAVLGSGAWRMARYDSATNSFIQFTAADTNQEAFRFRAGRGHWVRFEQDTELRVLGSAVPAGPFTMALTQGWNSLANPFDGPLVWDLSQIRVRVDGTLRGTLRDTATWDFVAPYSWVYDSRLGTHRLVFDPTWAGFSGTLSSVQRTQGFWIWAARPGVQLEFPAAAVGGRTTNAVKATTHDWTIGLTASTGNGASGGCVVGVSSGLARALRIQAPPQTSADAVTLTVLGPSDTRLAGEVRPATGELTWKLAVTSRAAGDVTLGWPALLRQAPSGLVFELTDKQTGQTVLLNAKAAYRYSATRAGETRQFELTAHSGRAERVTIEAFGTHPTRGGGTAVSLTLSAPAELGVTVRGVGGRLVKQVATQTAGSGVTTVTWDGTDQDGRPVARGTYVVEVTATAANGAVTRATRTVVVP
jgi:hypothetical protein